MNYELKVYQPKTPWTDGGYAPLWTDSAPANRIVVHRTGNPWATGESTCRWYDNQRGGSSHEVADGEVVWQVILPPHHMWHVLASEAARTKGYPVSDPAVQRGKARGDIRAFGIEGSEDFNAYGETMRTPWQAYRKQHRRASPNENALVRSGKAAHWKPATLNTLVERVGGLVLGDEPWCVAKIDDVYAHSELDPVTRAHDFDAFLSPDEFRERVAAFVRQERARRIVPQRPVQAATPPAAATPPPTATSPSDAATGENSALSVELLGRVQSLEKRMDAIAHAASGDEA